MPDASIEWLRKLQFALKDDPKRSGLLGVLSVVLIVVIGRAIFTGQAGPDTAGAALVSPSIRISDVTQKLDARKPTRAAGAPASLQQWLTSDKKPLNNNNLFTVRLEYFPRDGKASQIANHGGQGFWESVAKSLPSQADQKKERQILVENLQLHASELKLQTTLIGQWPKALINGELVKEGDVIAAGSGEGRTPFRVCRIETRRIIVEHEGIKFEILMK